MRAVLDRSEELCGWAAERLPRMHGRPFSDDARAIGVEDSQGKLLAAVVFHEWQPEYGTIQASACAESPRWLLARDALDTIFRYGFETCDCHKIWAATARSNERTLKFLRGLGFHFEAILYRQFGVDEDAVISSIFRWDYRSLHRDFAGHPNPARDVQPIAHPGGLFEAQSTQAA